MRIRYNVAKVRHVTILLHIFAIIQILSILNAKSSEYNLKKS